MFSFDVDERFYEDQIARTDCLVCFVGNSSGLGCCVFFGMGFLLFVLFVGLACVWVAAFPEVAGLVMFAFGAVLFMLQIPWSEG